MAGDAVKRWTWAFARWRIAFEIHLIERRIARKFAQAAARMGWETRRKAK